jgi:hypothetical protein
LSTSERTTPVSVLDTGHDRVNGLVAFAEAVLPTLRVESGLFCFDRSFDSTELRGESVRYSLMVLLGALRRAAHRGVPPVDIEGLHHVIASRRDALGVGDLGLLLWAEARMGLDSAGATIARLEHRSRDGAALARLEGMEIAWFVLGAVGATAADLPARKIFDRAFGHLRRRRSPSSPLFRHTGRGRGRALLPNFATQIYSLLALAETARHGLRSKATEQARALADTLIALRLPDGGWPWLFHADRAVVVEPYEIYSVHQDAMAPMALFALAEVTDDPSYAQAGVEGLDWCFGRNELGFRFYDPVNAFAHRSIRRRGWAHNANLWANAVIGGTLGLSARTGLGGVEVHATCRPYHLGWVLEAWSGREHLASPSATGS